MKNHRFPWLRNRTTDNRKCEKARNIKEKRTIEMFNQVSNQLVEHHSSANVNRCCSILYFLSRKHFAFGIFLKISKIIYYQEEIEIQIRNQNKNQAKIQSKLNRKVCWNRGVSAR